MIVDAVVLAGGRGSRLGGIPKAGLIVEGRTLLERALAAASAARRTVVVGDPRVIAEAAPGRDPLVTREEPPFAGPAAGIAAGVHALGPGSDLTLVLACDLPCSSGAVDALLRAADARGAVAVDASGRLQHLLALYPTAALADAIRGVGSLENASVRSLVGGLAIAPVEVPPRSTDDIDTWDDADAHGIAREGEPA